MIQLFPHEPACTWCGGEHPQAQLCHARPGLSRRSFLFLASVGAVAAVVAPNLLLPSAEPPMFGYSPISTLFHGPNTDWDIIFKEVYCPAITAQLNSENTLLRFMSMSPAELDAHRIANAAAEARYQHQQQVERLERRVWKLESYRVSEARLRRERNRLYALKYLPPRTRVA